MIDFFHNGGVDPNPWVEKDAADRASHPKRSPQRRLAHRHGLRMVTRSRGARRREADNRHALSGKGMIGLWLGILICAGLIASVVPSLSAAAAITVVNQSSLTAGPDDSFAAAIRQGRYGPELAVTGHVAERTVSGERLTEAVLEIIVAQADGTQLWAGQSPPLKPGSRLDWRVAVQPFGVLDGTLIAQVIVRDRDVSTAERKEREARDRAEAEQQAALRREREARQHAEAERQATLKREREARDRAEVERQAALRRERDREAAIKARGWPKQIERAVIERTVLPGMNSEQVSLAWGPPSQVNETIRASGVSQQWVYSGSRYVYFENGRVTAIQTSR